MSRWGVLRTAPGRGHALRARVPCQIIAISEPRLPPPPVSQPCHVSRRCMRSPTQLPLSGRVDVPSPGTWAGLRDRLDLQSVAKARLHDLQGGSSRRREAASACSWDFLSGGRCHRSLTTPRLPHCEEAQVTGEATRAQATRTPADDRGPRPRVPLSVRVPPRRPRVLWDKPLAVSCLAS